MSGIQLTAYRVQNAGRSGFCGVNNILQNLLVPSGTMIFEDPLFEVQIGVSSGSDWKYLVQWNEWGNPALTANGVMGVDNFACIADGNSASAFRAFDRTATAFSSVNVAPPHWLAWYSRLPVRLAEMRVTNYTSANGNLVNWEIQVSDDNQNWSTVGSGTNTNVAAGNVYSLPVTYSGMSQYWRLYVSSLSGTGNYWYLQELELDGFSPSPYLPITSTVYDMGKSPLMMGSQLERPWAHYEGHFYSYFACPNGSYFLLQSEYEKIQEYISLGGTLGWGADQKPRVSMLDPWTRPNLSANGTLGGSSFAVDCDTFIAGMEAFRAFDANKTGTMWNTSWRVTPHTLTWYNPKPIVVHSVTITNGYNYTDYGASTSGILQGSKDGVTWYNLKPYTNDVIGYNAEWTIVNDIYEEPYRYHRIYSTGSSYWDRGRTNMMADVAINAQEVRTGDLVDYVVPDKEPPSTYVLAMQGSDSANEEPVPPPPPVVPDDYAEFVVMPPPDRIVKINLRSTGTYNFTVDWGDGTAIQTFTTWNDSRLTHTYPAVTYGAMYTMKINGILTQGGVSAAGGDGIVTGSAISAGALVEVKNFTLSINNLDNLFSYCRALYRIPVNTFSRCASATSMRYCLQNTPLDMDITGMLAPLINVSDFTGMMRSSTNLRGISDENLLSSQIVVSDITDMLYENKRIKFMPLSAFILNPSATLNVSTAFQGLFSVGRLCEFWNLYTTSTWANKTTCYNNCPNASNRSQAISNGFATV